MPILLKNGQVYQGESFERRDILISDGKLFVFEGTPSEDTEIIDIENKILIPGFTDVHVHFREPGFSYKETILTGTKAAAAGGYTCCLTMPNLDPAPADFDSLKVQLDIIERDAACHVVPYGTITRGQDGRSELSDMEAMAPYVCAFTDDGKGVQTEGLMDEAMEKAASLNKMIVAHCEDESLLLPGACVHDGEFAKAHGLTGISSASEWKQVERDVELAASKDCAYHVCHVSTKESVDIIRKAKARGIDVTCETAPHYLLLTDSDLEDEGRFKMNPPIRSAKDRDALIEGIKDGTVDMIATDHAPHSAEEKAKGLAGSAFGIVGLETSFPVLYTGLVKKGIISLEKLIDVMAASPRKRFSLPGGVIENSSPADIAVIDLEDTYTIDPEAFKSKGRATPFEGWEVSGRVLMTFLGGKLIYEYN